MHRLDRAELKRLIQLEFKSLMDEDALMDPPSLGEPNFMRSTNKSSQIDYDDYLDHDEEFEARDSKKHTDNCDCPVCLASKISLRESCSCGHVDQHNYPYEEEKEEYSDHHDHDHKSSSYMARPQLVKLAKYASSLLDMVDVGEELEDWQESKIAQMSQMMGDVYHSIEYDEMGDEHDDLDVHDLLGMIRTGNI